MHASLSFLCHHPALPPALGAVSTALGWSGAVRPQGFPSPCTPQVRHRISRSNCLVALACPPPAFPPPLPSPRPCDASAFAALGARSLGWAAKPPSCATAGPVKACGLRSASTREGHLCGYRPRHCPGCMVYARTSFFVFAFDGWLLTAAAPPSLPPAPPPPLSVWLLWRASLRGDSRSLV